MATNKFAQECKDCGEIVLPGKGSLTQEWSNQDDDMAWVVRHADKSTCEMVEADRKNDVACSKTINAVLGYINAVLGYIKEYGERSDEIKDGSETVYDGRKGYNSVG